MYLKDSLDFSPILSLKLFLPSHLFLFFVFVSLVWSLPSVCVQLCNGVSVRIGEGFTLSIYLSCVCHSVFLFPYFDWFQLFFFRTRCTTYPFFSTFKNPRGICKQIFKNFFFLFKEKCQESYPSAKRRKQTNFMCWWFSTLLTFFFPVVNFISFFSSINIWLHLFLIMCIYLHMVRV